MKYLQLVYIVVVLMVLKIHDDVHLVRGPAILTEIFPSFSQSFRTNYMIVF